MAIVNLSFDFDGTISAVEKKGIFACMLGGPHGPCVAVFDSSGGNIREAFAAAAMQDEIHVFQHFPNIDVDHIAQSVGRSHDFVLNSFKDMLNANMERRLSAEALRKEVIAQAEERLQKSVVDIYDNGVPHRKEHKPNSGLKIGSYTFGKRKGEKHGVRSLFK